MYCTVQVLGLVILLLRHLLFLYFTVNHLDTVSIQPTTFSPNSLMELGNCIRANKKGFSSSNGFNKQNCAGILLENISIILLMTIARYLVSYLIFRLI